MDADPKKILERLSRAPLSFGIACFGMGIIVGGDWFSHLGFSSGAKELIGSLTAGLGILLFGINCPEEESCEKPKIKTDEGKSEREE